jgi:hypothetical protein
MEWLQASTYSTTAIKLDDRRSDGGSHFIDRTFWKALLKVGVDHRITTPYHPQMSDQANQEYPSEDNESNGQKLEEQAQ